MSNGDAYSDPIITPFEGALVTQPYMPGVGSGYIEPYHRGIDIGLPAGSAVRLPAGGTYQEGVSSPYVSVFKLANGLYEGIAHIVATHYKDQAYVPKGTPIGTVDPRQGDITYSSYGGTVTDAYSSIGPHVHVDEYTTPEGASMDFGHSVNPYGLFSMPDSNPTPANSGDILKGIGDTVGGVAGGILKGIGDGLGAIDKAGGNLLHGSGVPDPIKGGVDTGKALKGDPSALASDIGLGLPPDIGIRIAAVLLALVLIIAGAMVLTK